MSDLTVLFATRNGMNVLPYTFEGYLAQEANGLDWQMIVVDNGSSDGTPEWLRSYESRLPLTVLEQPKPGKNCALNLGLSHVKSDFVIVSDDDAIPDPDFLARWLEVAGRTSEYDLFGGRIEPEFQLAPPPWMSAGRFNYDVIFAERDLPEGPMKAGEIFGPNMAVRKRVFDAGHRFNEEIGPNGANPNYGMGSETEFCRRVEAAGYQAFFASGPRVRHIVRPHQVSDEFWQRRAYRHGYGFAQQNGKEGLPYWKSPRAPLFGLRHGVFQALRRGLSKISRDEYAANWKLWNYHWQEGYRDALKALAGYVTPP